MTHLTDIRQLCRDTTPRNAKRRTGHVNGPKCPSYVTDIKYCHCPCHGLSRTSALDPQSPFYSHCFFSIFSLATFITLAKIMQMSCPKDAIGAGVEEAACPFRLMADFEARQSVEAKCPLMVMGPKCAFQPCQLLDRRKCQSENNVSQHKKDAERHFKF